MLQEAQAQRDAAQAALAASQQELTVRNQQLAKAQSRTETSKVPSQNVAQERWEQSHLGLADAEWNMHQQMKELELESRHQREMGHIELEAQWSARFNLERNRLQQELTAAREKVRLSNDAAAEERGRRLELERQLEHLRTRERIQPELLKALFSVDRIAQKTSQAASCQHFSVSSAPLNLPDSSKYLLNAEEPPDSSLGGDSKRRRLSYSCREVFEY